ncbi:hypothetical protein IH979_02910 [Patescibacteria group bacterium]|nr:hypothetical protein [Patescibacteria group bacterium]
MAKKSELSLTSLGIGIADQEVEEYLEQMIAEADLDALKKLGGLTGFIANTVITKVIEMDSVQRSILINALAEFIRLSPIFPGWLRLAAPTVLRSLPAGIKRNLERKDYKASEFKKDLLDALHNSEEIKEVYQPNKACTGSHEYDLIHRVGGCAGAEVQKDYSDSIFQLTKRYQHRALCPICFGEEFAAGVIKIEMEDVEEKTPSLTSIITIDQAQVIALLDAILALRSLEIIHEPTSVNTLNQARELGLLAYPEAVKYLPSIGDLAISDAGEPIDEIYEQIRILRQAGEREPPGQREPGLWWRTTSAPFVGALAAFLTVFAGTVDFDRLKHEAVQVATVRARGWPWYWRFLMWPVIGLLATAITIFPGLIRREKAKDEAVDSNEEAEDARKHVLGTLQKYNPYLAMIRRVGRAALLKKGLLSAWEARLLGVVDYFDDRWTDVQRDRVRVFKQAVFNRDWGTLAFTGLSLVAVVVFSGLGLLTAFYVFVWLFSVIGTFLVWVGFIASVALSLGMHGLGDMLDVERSTEWLTMMFAVWCIVVALGVIMFIPRLAWPLLDRIHGAVLGALPNLSAERGLKGFIEDIVGLYRQATSVGGAGESTDEAKHKARAKPTMFVNIATTMSIIGMSAVILVTLVNAFQGSAPLILALTVLIGATAALMAEYMKHFRLLFTWKVKQKNANMGLRYMVYALFFFVFCFGCAGVGSCVFTSAAAQIEENKLERCEFEIEKAAESESEEKASLECRLLVKKQKKKQTR